MRPNRREMLRHLERYEFTGQGAEQDFLTDFWRHRGGIATLPRKYNCQLHQVGLLGPEVPGDSVYWRLVTNHPSDVANWHFSADPKPVDMVCEERQSRTDTSLLRGNVVGRYVLEALMCGAHLQTYSDKEIRRIMYLCPNIAGYPGTKLLSPVWEMRELADERTYAEGDSPSLNECLVEAAIGGAARPRVRPVRGHRHRYHGHTVHERLVLSSRASCLLARNQNHSARQKARRTIIWHSGQRRQAVGEH